MTGPPRAARRRAIAWRAAGVAVMRAPTEEGISCSEQAEGFGAVADEQVLGLAVVVEHHAVVLPSDTGDLVATERGPRGVLVVAVRPDPARLDGAAHPVGAIAVTGPHAGTESVEGVIGDRQRVRLVGEGRDREHGAEDLLLEDPHLVVALEHGGLEVVALGELAADLGTPAADEDLGALVAADLDIGGDLVDLLLRHLRADLGIGIERVALLDLGDPLQAAGHELRSEEHTSELQSRRDLVCRLLLEKKKNSQDYTSFIKKKTKKKTK